ncbi:MAG: hypothetical protein LBI90_04035 [Treponema sp.]|nr:hypothetical protein [Treponema sp.]
MKSGVANPARLILFFSLSFAGIFIFSALLYFLIIKTQAAGIFPLQGERNLSEFLEAARWALALSVHGAILAALSYSARRRIFAPLSIPLIVFLACAMSFIGFWALERANFLPPAQFPPKTVGQPGLILTQPGAVIVLLEEPEKIYGPRVVAMDGQPLLFQANPRGTGALPRLPFISQAPWFLRSLSIDINLAGIQMEALFKRGPVPFIIYAGALIFFLASCRFILEFSVWPLANFFLGILAVRGVLALETFVNSPEIADFLGFYLGQPELSAYAVPLSWCLFAVLICLYTFLVSLIKKRQKNEV